MIFEKINNPKQKMDPKIVDKNETLHFYLNPSL